MSIHTTLTKARAHLVLSTSMHTMAREAIAATDASDEDKAAATQFIDARFSKPVLDEYVASTYTTVEELRSISMAYTEDPVHTARLQWFDSVTEKAK